MSSTNPSIVHGLYTAARTAGVCRLCDQRKDLRFGACFDCADYVDGQLIGGMHELWDKRYPSNKWFVKE